MTNQFTVSMCALGIASVVAGASRADTAYPHLDVLLQSETTIIGQPIEYPEGIAQITAAIVTLQPGQATGWHRHEAPLTAYVLEGEITVDYDADGTRVYRQGDALIEALGTRHNGENTGNGVVRILVVYSGAVGTPNTVSE